MGRHALANKSFPYLGGLAEYLPGRTLGVENLGQLFQWTICVDFLGGLCVWTIC